MDQGKRRVGCAAQDLLGIAGGAKKVIISSPGGKDVDGTLPSCSLIQSGRVGRGLVLRHAAVLSDLAGSG